jgi:hypothetical protein
MTGGRVDKVSSIILVDQQIGTGFSYSTDVQELRLDKAGVSEDMYEIFQEFRIQNTQTTNFTLQESLTLTIYFSAVNSDMDQVNKGGEEFTGISGNEPFFLLDIN